METPWQQRVSSPPDGAIRLSLYAKSPKKKKFVSCKARPVWVQQEKLSGRRGGGNGGRVDVQVGWLPATEAADPGWWWMCRWLQMIPAWHAIHAPRPSGLELQPQALLLTAADCFIQSLTKALTAGWGCCWSLISYQLISSKTLRPHWPKYLLLTVQVKLKSSRS